MSFPGPANFERNAAGALADGTLQRELETFSQGFRVRRVEAAARLPEFEALRDEARDIRDHTLDHLDFYLERFEENCRAAGGHVHWCATAGEARRTILDICERLGARTMAKGKSMVSEEIGLNDFLAEHGIEAVETDLGEYIIQLRKEPPSHIVAPAIHVATEQWAESFRKAHTDLPADRPLLEPADIMAEARAALRERFLAADVGLTGANFLVAETGSSVIFTNEGNGDLSQTLPRAHIVIAGIEKVVPTLEDLSVLMRVLPRSATGQELTVYTTLSTGPRRAGDLDGPEEYHVVLLDNGRSGMLGDDFREMLRCIRCAACMNACPVYRHIGGHAYGWVYPGPMGAVLTPALRGIGEAGHLPNASTFCGKCEEVCPVRIPLPKMMRHWREREFERKLAPPKARYGLALWRFLAARPGLYRSAASLAARLLARRRPWRRLPFAGAWTASRDFPPAEGRTFLKQWQDGRRR